jgi:hypothetical protein
MAGPAAHVKYLHNLSSADLYRDDVEDLLKGVSLKDKSGKKRDINEIVDEIVSQMGQSGSPLHEHYAGNKDYHIVAAELRNFLKANPRRLRGDKISKKLAKDIAQNVYWQKAYQQSSQDYSVELQQMSAGEAKKSLGTVVKDLLGRDSDLTDIDGLETQEDIASKAREYHQESYTRVADKHEKGEFLDKKTHRDYLAYKAPAKK